VAGEEVHDSPVGWVAKHIKRYLASAGADGHRWGRNETLLLTTRGRKTGKLRRTALIYGRDGERFVVVGSHGGSSKHPSWYLNLLAEPRVDVQVGAETFAATARPAAGDERDRLWTLMTGVFPTYASFQRKTKREIPVVVIERR
jgi:deazaflavin-dependent oxidoreductase (nitroreductase family)